MFLLRFDMRAPSWGPASPETLYETALEMATWAEDQGGIQLVISEHHGVEDGYLPAPLILAASMAARTKQIPIQVAAPRRPSPYTILLNSPNRWLYLIF